MPFLLIISGLVLLIAAVRGDACGQMQCHEYLFYLLANDFTGPNNFVFWFLSILLIGSLGYVEKLKPIADGLLILLIVVLFLSKGKGFFDMFSKQIAATQSDKPIITGGNTFTGAGGNVIGKGGIGGSGISVGIGSGGITIGGGGISVTLPPFGGGGGGGLGGVIIPGFTGF